MSSNIRIFNNSNTENININLALGQFYEMFNSLFNNSLFNDNIETFGILIIEMEMNLKIII